MLDRTIAPEFAEPEYFSFSKVNSEILSNGIPFHFINAGEVELIRLELIFKAGKWFQTKKGQAVLTSKMLLEGTKNYSSNEISKSFERNGAFFEISCGMDYINFTIYTLNRNLQTLLPIIEEILVDPVFPNNELETLKNIQIQNLKVNLEKNSFLASKLFRKKLFGQSHPYGITAETDDINSLSRNDLIDYYNNTIQGNFEVIVSGKINKNDSELLKKIFSRFTRTNPVIPFIENKQHAVTIEYVEKEASVQSSLRIGKKSLHKKDPEYFHLLMFNEILGGYFGSRLMQKIREEKGYSYGIHSSIAHHKEESYFIISSDVIKKYRQDAIHSIYNEIELLINNPVPQKELKTVVSYFKGSFLSSINSPYALADKFKNLHFNGLTYDYYENLFPSLDAITPASLQSFIKNHFSMGDFTEVSVG